MGTLKLILSIVEVLACVFLTVVILLQQGCLLYTSDAADEL